MILSLRTSSYNVVEVKQMSITKILGPKSGYITELIHISDVHIRNGDEVACRFNEYKTVFENLFGDLKRMSSVKGNTAVIVLTGDQFHHKSKLETPGIKLFMSMMTNLGEIAPTYIILGNHDFRQEQIEDGIDFLEAFDDCIPENVCFLQETGLYQAANVGFGLVSVKDTLRLGSGSGMADSLPDFPTPSLFGSDVTHTAALFHGTMRHSKYTDTRVSDEGYPWAWMDVGYNIALLGDIHKQQVFPKSKSGLQAAYAGSLIQQNFGESLIKGHGYLVWKLEDKRNATVLSKDVYNDYGFVKLTIKNGEWLSDGNHLTEIVKMSTFPTKLKLRIYGSYTPEEFQNLRTILLNKEYYLDDFVIKDDTTSTQSSDYASDALLEKFMAEKGVENYEVPYIDDIKIRIQEEWCDELKKVAQKKNLELDKEYAHYRNTTEKSQQTRKISIRYVEWTGLLCYSDKNWIDFDTMKGTTNLISAKNGGGKSSFLEIVCLSIFGKPIPTRSIKGNGLALIAKGKKPDVKSQTSIHIMYDGQTYCIMRTFDDEGKQKGRNTGVYRKKEDGWELVCADPPKTNDWVANSLGDIHGFLMTTLITQSNDDDFLSMKPIDQRNHLEQLLGMKEANAKANLFKHCHQINRSFKNSLDIAYGNQGHDITIGNEEELHSLNGTYQRELLKLNGLEKKLTHSWGACKIEDLELNNEDIKERIRQKEQQVAECKPCDRDKVIGQIAKMKANIDCNEENFTREIKNIDISNVNEDTINLFQNQMNETKTKIAVVKNELQNLHPPCQKPGLSIDDDFKFYTEKLNKVIRVSKTHNMHVVNEPKPQFSEDDICKMENQVKQEMSLTKPSKDNYEHAKQDLLHMEHHIAKLNEQHSNTTLEKNTKEEEEDKLNSDYQELIKYRKTCPAVSKNEIYFILNELDSNEKFHKDYLKEHADYTTKTLLWKQQKENIKNVRDELEQVNFALDEIERGLKDTPFNPNCKACCAQPLRKQLSKLKSKKVDLDCKLEIANEELIEDPTLRFQEITDWLQNYNDKMELKDSYSKMKDEWTIYDDETLKLSSIDSNLKSIRCVIRQLRLNIKDNLTEIELYQGRLYDAKSKIKIYEEYKQKQSKWDENMAFIVSVNAQWYLYKISERTIKINSKHSEYTSKLDEIKTQLKERELYAQYESKVENGQTRLSKHENELEKKTNICKSYEYQKNLSKYTKEHQKCKMELLENDEYNLIKKEHDYWCETLNNKENYDFQQNLEKEIVISKDILHELHGKRVKLECSITENAKIIEKAKILKSHQTFLQEKIERLSSLGNVFDKYRAWLYEEHILPKLVKRANQFVNTVESKLKLCYTMLPDNTFCFTAKNDLHEVALEKTSGFEYFILSTCLRLAFITLTLGEGSLGGQLMIDEGFTACDGNHLTKIPAFLQSLLGKFDSIILVSHIERIKESVDNTIFINNRQIRYGSAHEFTKPLVPRKKRTKKDGV